MKICLGDNKKNLKIHTTMDGDSNFLCGLNPTARIFIPKTLRKEENKKNLRITYESIMAILSSMENDLNIPIGYCDIKDTSLTIYLSNESIMTFTPVNMDDIYFYDIYVEYCIVVEDEWKSYADERYQFRFSNENPLDQTIAQFIYLSLQTLYSSNE